MEDHILLILAVPFDPARSPAWAEMRAHLEGMLSRLRADHEEADPPARLAPLELVA